MIDTTTRHDMPTRAMFYCHDTSGLGHLRRTLTLANHLRTSMPGMSQLIVTGSPSARGCVIPDEIDYVKLPAVTRTDDGEYASHALSSSFDAISDMRRDILLSTARHFQPDLFFVDHAPAGLKGEVIDTLRYLKAALPDTRLIVGLRDIVDEAPRVRESWARDGVYELLDDVFDRIFVYGHRQLYDVVREYGLSPKAAAKTRFVGYLGLEPGARSAAEVRAALPMQTNKLAVVTAGEGGEGGVLFDTVMRGIRTSPLADTVDWLLIGNPPSSRVDRIALQTTLQHRNNLHVLDVTDDTASYIAAADVVVSTGGYNAICEVLSMERPSIVVPRVTPRREQLVRAEMLSRFGAVHMIHPRDLTPNRIVASALGLLGHDATVRFALPMDGLQNVANAVSSLMPRYQPAAANHLSAAHV